VSRSFLGYPTRDAWTIVGFAFIAEITSLTFSMSDPSYSVFGLISSPRLSEKRAHLLHAQTGICRDWSCVPQMAARHQVGPLLYWHLKEYGISYPPEIRRAMAAMYARQKMIAAAQSATLTEIIKAFADASIESVVLKGGALAHIVYSEPGLRPMEDLDILVSPEKAMDAHALLIEIGLLAPMPTSRFDLLQHHFPLAQRTRDDITVSVELHTTAFNLLLGDKLSVKNMTRPLHKYTVLKQTIQTFNPVQMLWMQYLGMRKLAEPLRYIHLSDLVGMAECLIDDIDWPMLRHRYPDLWNAYQAVHAFSPLCDSVCERLELIADRQPEMNGIGDDFNGWPRQGFTQFKGFREKMQLVSRSVSPPEWWARLVYGLRTNHSLATILLYHHPTTFVRQALRRLYLGPVNQLGFFKGRI
jgi:hypothetical protein